MATVTVRHAKSDAVVEQVITASAQIPAVTMRPRNGLRTAARKGRLLVAYQGSAVAGWALAEPCGPGVNELGMLVVLPNFRDGSALRELTATGVGLRRRSVVVTMDERFAHWLTSEWNFVRTGLGGAVINSRGMFLFRRLAPRRLRTALSRVSSGSPIYLVREEDST